MIRNKSMLAQKTLFFMYFSSLSTKDVKFISFTFLVSSLFLFAFIHLLLLHFVFSPCLK